MRFFDLSHDTRFAIYKAIESVGCQTYPGGGGGSLCVAVSKGRFGDLCEALKPFCLKNSHLYYFPLGTDKPADEFRHDRHGVAASTWLVAVFQ
jgi:hypothetical protein